MHAQTYVISKITKTTSYHAFITRTKIKHIIINTIHHLIFFKEVKDSNKMGTIINRAE